MSKVSLIAGCNDEKYCYFLFGGKICKYNMRWWNVLQPESEIISILQGISSYRCSHQLPALHCLDKLPDLF